ncbi:transmembrane protein 68 isoform X1 [Lutra lutra]|uniref:transmembrane protein 68 isoform X1 n=3 Tax=Lutrinae TaxID=169417 RepID=UPI001FD330A8|nr:transmembrane protein 68 isoform X1 [Lutra lutra]XP_047580511.1 transmembrane protein 68 isoform X1 [Lutra lutra]XP_047580512.1 transmembrane protein 68 isoform X1 [Lutra lutra]XP_047580513.1 transmembrane protein 68 isoform X1 [Lutra lutra]
MINKNQTCGTGQDSMPYMTCLIHILEEWFGVEQLEDYLNFANYLLWVFTPLILLILPYFTIFLLYLTIIFLHIYKRKNVLKEAYSHNLWDGARKTVATLWDGHAAVWHGYEVHGMEKIPEEGPALIIFYHGAIPIDFYYFMAKIFIHKGRTCRVVADHFVFKIPGFSLLLDVFCALHGPREKCVEILRSGHLLAISPGGVREALISDETYNIIWGNRKGFAQVAIDAKVMRKLRYREMKGWRDRVIQQGRSRAEHTVQDRRQPRLLPSLTAFHSESADLEPIIPMFTQNIREGFRSLGGTRLFRWLYEKFRYPFAPMYGGFPVKLRTYLGDPIPYDPKITAEELAEKTKNALQALIDKHQRIPGNIMSALLERFHKKQKTD